MTQPIDYRVVDSDAGLQAMVAELDTASVLAIDTEFMRTDTFYPKPALLQFSDGRLIYLVDPLGIDDWQVLRALLTEPTVTKLLHSVSEDFEVFQRLLGCLPQPLLDTQVGAGLAGIGVGMGYQRLVDAVLGIAVEKGETRSDWLQRPLSDEQLRYAALDVVHLIPLYQKIRQRLDALGRVDWWWEEGRRQVGLAEQSSPPEASFQRIKSAWKLDAAQQARLRALCAWRECRARELNVPRGWILKDPVCVEIARRNPTHLAALATIDGLRESTVRKDGQTICDLLASAPPLAPDEVLPAPPVGEQKERLQRLRAQLDNLARERDIPRELLLNKRDLEAIVRSGKLPAGLEGWRTPLIAPLIDAP